MIISSLQDHFNRWYHATLITTQGYSEGSKNCFPLYRWDNSSPEWWTELHKVIVLPRFQCDICGIMSYICSTMNLLKHKDPCRVSVMLKPQICWVGSRSLNVSVCLSPCFHSTCRIMPCDISLLKSIWAQDLDVLLRALHPCDSAPLVMESHSFS